VASGLTQTTWKEDVLQIKLSVVTDNQSIEVAGRAIVSVKVW
jgi:hypothetical protein